MAPSKEATEMLLNWTHGQPQALDQLMPLVYDELRRLARHYLRGERPDHTLQATALVHEAYLQLIDQKATGWKSRAHFIGVAAQLLRQILVQHARTHRRVKRGGGLRRLTLEDAVGLSPARDMDLEALDDALTGLAALSPEQSRIVELRFFGGLTVEETAEVLGVSPVTVKRQWRSARAWLYGQLKDEG